jgi:heme A synthase
MVTSKSWFLSKIFWAGVITTILGILPVIQTWLNNPQPMTIDNWLTMAAGVLTVIFRLWFTNQTLN